MGYGIRTWATTDHEPADSCSARGGTGHGRGGGYGYGYGHGGGYGYGYGHLTGL